MKFDIELARLILLDLQEAPPTTSYYDIALDSYTEEQISYHVMLLNQAGFIGAVEKSTLSKFCWKPTNLTWEGQKFIDAAKDDKLWNKFKKHIKDKGAAIALETGKTLLIEWAKQKLKITSGSSSP